VIGFVLATDVIANSIQEPGFFARLSSYLRPISRISVASFDIS
jgi:hypothetical protein